MWINTTDHTLLNHHYKDKVFFMEAHPPVMGAPNGFIPVRNSLMRSSLILSRIAITSNQYKIEFEPSHTYGTAHLWTELLGRRQHILEHINEMLSNYDVESLPSAVIRRLCDFMNIEVTFLSTLPSYYYIYLYAYIYIYIYWSQLIKFLLSISGISQAGNCILRVF